MIKSLFMVENMSPTRDTVAFFNDVELHDRPRSFVGISPTLGQLFKRVGDMRREANGDGNETPVCVK